MMRETRGQGKVTEAYSWVVKLGLSGMEILWHGGQMLKHQVDRRWKDGLHTRACVCVCALVLLIESFPKN